MTRHTERGTFCSEVQRRDSGKIINMEVNLTFILTGSQTLLGEVDRKEKNILSKGNNFNKMLRKEVWYANG